LEQVRPSVVNLKVRVPSGAADDNLQITRILSEFVKKEGYAPVIAEDGEKALQLFQADQYAVLPLDVMMPKMNGFSLCREIRRTSNVPIIMITARSEDFERIMGLDIAREIALRHHVDMTCDSVPGAGTRFTLTFRDEA